MKEEIRKYFKIDTYKMEEEKRRINDNYILYYDLLKEIKDKPEEERQKEIENYNKQREERENKLQKINDNLKIAIIEKNIIHNNIIYLFYKNYHNIITNIMSKYENKAIGEKTKEKIQNEIKEELQKNGVFAGVWFSFGSYSCDIYKLNFTIYETEEAQKNYSYKKIEFSYNLCNYYGEEEKEKYKNYYYYRNEKTDLNIINNNKIWDNNTQYNYIEEPKKEARNILKECQKRIEKVNKLIKQAKETRADHNNFLNIYKINEFESIKIDYQQTL